MAAPSNIIVTPNQSDAVDLPRAVTITGTDMFERPNYTGRELFTQSTPDVLVADWNGGATQGSGIIGDSFVGNGTNAYVDITSKLPDYKSTDFIGVSAWVKFDDVALPRSIFSLKNDNDNQNRPIEVVFHPAYDIYCWAQSGPSNGKVISNQITPNVGEWYHIFGYVDYRTGLDIGLFVNGVQYTHVAYNGGITGYSAGTCDICTIGMRTNAGSPTSYMDGNIANMYWSTNPLFKNEVLKYSNLPTFEVV